jgi:hypothetical protein
MNIRGSVGMICINFKKLTSVITVSAACVVPSIASASNSAAGQVTLMYGTNYGSFLFTSTGTRTAVPSCAQGLPTRWAIDVTTTSGQTMAALLMSAYSMGKTVSVYGTGACPTVEPDAEGVLYLMVND